MLAVRRLTTILSLSLVATALSAQTRPAPDAAARRTTEQVSAETDRDASNARALRLSLTDALGTAMRNNLGVELQGYDFRMAGENLRSNYGIYDWFGTATLQRESAEGAVISQAEPSKQGVNRFNFGVQQNLPAGGNYAVGLNTSRVETVGGFVGVSPAYRPNGFLSVNQPLLRNFGIDVTGRGVLIARNTLGINRELFRTALMNTAEAVEQAYLNLIYSRRAVEVVKETLFLARDQSRITQIRIDVGASAPLDILQPRVTIATQEEQLILAVARVRDAEDQLRALMNLPRDEWERPILPTQDVTYTPMTVDQTAAVARALELRPELRQARLTTDIRRVQYIYARNQRLPQLDLNLDYGLAGVAGRSRQVDPATGVVTIRDTGLGDALGQVFRNDFPSWSVGVQVGVPFTNIGARAEARRAQLDLESSKVDHEQTEQTVALAVRAAARNVDTAARTIVASRTARDAAERNLEAERRRYENGMTTNFQVLQIQQQLSDSRVRELQALVGYNQAVANYHREVGDILEVRGIVTEEPETVNEPRVFSLLDRYNWLNYGSRLSDEELRK